MSSRACVYMDYRSTDSDSTRCILRICGPTATIGSLQQDAEMCAGFGEVLDGFRIFFEDPISDPKKVPQIVMEK